MQVFLNFVVEHWFLWSLLVLFAVLLIITEIQLLKGGAPRLTPQQAVQLINREKAVVLDMRAGDAFKQGHILGAKLVDMAKVTQDSSALSKHMKKTIVVVCNAGQQSQKLAASLKKQGFEKVYQLSGGMNAWRSANLPVVKE